MTSSDWAALADLFENDWGRVQDTAEANCRAKKWHKGGEAINDGLEIALMHSELSEALEAFRRGNPNNIKVAPVGGESEPVFSEAELELADVVIRLACYCSRKGFRMARAVIAKLRYNEGRPVRHGGKLF